MSHRMRTLKGSLPSLPSPRALSGPSRARQVRGRARGEGPGEGARGCARGGATTGAATAAGLKALLPGAAPWPPGRRGAPDGDAHFLQHGALSRIEVEAHTERKQAIRGSAGTGCGVGSERQARGTALFALAVPSGPALAVAHAAESVGLVDLLGAQVARASINQN